MSEESVYQERYWRELTQLRIHIYYLEIYQGEDEKKEWWLQVLLAVTSSGSIGGWALWNEFGFIWAFIIAVSQVVNAIRHLLPFQKRIKALSGLTRELEELFLHAEREWYNVGEGRLANEEIHQAQMEIKDRKRQYHDRHMKAMYLPERSKYLEIAEEKARTYFKNFYDLEI